MATRKPPIKKPPARKSKGPAATVDAGAPGQVTPSQASRAGSIGNVSTTPPKNQPKPVQGGKPPTKKPTPTPKPIQGGKPPSPTPQPPNTGVGGPGQPGSPASYQPGPAGGQTVGKQPDYTKLMKGLTGATRDAYVALTDLFNSYGLSTLAPTILKYLQQGFSSSTITVLLQDTPEYKKRFAGNTARLANGLPVLTPAEYLSVEESYRQILQSSGIEKSMMTESNFSDWIGKDISPNEISSRVQLAQQAVLQSPASVQAAFAQMGVTAGELSSFFLNTNTPLAQMQTKMTQAQIMGAGIANGLKVDQQAALGYAQAGVTQAQAQAGYQRIADILPTANQLSQIYHQQATYGQTQAEQEFLGQSGSAQLAREQLSMQEQAAFKGSAGTGQQSFAQVTKGVTF